MLILIEITAIGFSVDVIAFAKIFRHWSAHCNSDEIGVSKKFGVPENFTQSNLDQLSQRKYLFTIVYKLIDLF